MTATIGAGAPRAGTVLVLTGRLVSTVVAVPRDAMAVTVSAMIDGPPVRRKQSAKIATQAHQFPRTSSFPIWIVAHEDDCGLSPRAMPNG